METVHCSCGTDYRPKDATAVKRHEATDKHRYSIAAAAPADDWALDDTLVTTSLDEVVIKARRLEADHAAGHPEMAGGGSCDWCIAEDLLDDQASGISDEPLVAETEEPVAKPKRKAKAKVLPVTPVQGGSKVCRVCGVQKQLDEYRRKSNRPDGRDTICAACAKAWLVAHKAKASAS